MKLNRKTQLLIFSSIAALTSSIVISRNSFQPNSEKFLEQISAETAEKWKKELSLTASQTLQMQRIISKFAGKKNKVIFSDKSRDLQKELLRKLQEMENNEIQQILNKSQYNGYLNLLHKSVKGH